VEAAKNAKSHQSERPMRRPSIFKKTDVTRATKAVLAAGLEVARIEIGRDGAIVVVPGRPAVSPRDEADGRNEWDGIPA
jgi:hypothetical protein